MTSSGPEYCCHVSMSSDEGSRVFCAESMLFRIPKSLLSRYSEVFSTMMSLKDESDEPIDVQDSKDAFTVFCEAVIMPYECCLMQTEPRLVDILNLLVISNKYDAYIIEERAYEIALRMTKPEILPKHLSNGLTAMQVVKIALNANRADIASSAWLVVMEQFRDNSLGISEVLGFAEMTGVASFIGSAYYETMRRGHGAWNKSSLNDNQRRKLWIGTATFTDASGEVARCLSTNLPATPHSCSHYVSQVCAYKNLVINYRSLDQISAYDVIERLKIVLGNLELPPRPSSDHSEYMGLPRTHNSCDEAAEALVRRFLEYFDGERLASYFVAAVDSGPSNHLSVWEAQGILPTAPSLAHPEVAAEEPLEFD